MKEIISTEKAPAAIGPYSQAVKANGFVFVSGQIPVIPVTGEFALGGIQEQTAQCIKNGMAILAQEGLTLDNVVKTTVYLSDMEDFAPMNEVYASYFSKDPPARSAIQVGKLPMRAMVEIEMIAAE